MKLDVYIHAQYDEYEKKYDFRVWSHDMTGSEYIGPLVGKTEIEFEPPPHEVMVNGTIATYRLQQQKIRAEAEKNCQQLQQRINDMLCLEHKPEPETPLF
jgi:hypothetical protein